ncbi:MAG: TIGR04149 family rSAM-modified RiPP [Dysgonamonadaceae bacterium]|nr:TIGR04149 family rSAM-modified RiPP [Dysgonamonadaceae bacterium]
MKKINLKGISEALSEKELKNVIGGNTILEGPSGEIKMGGDDLQVVQAALNDDMMPAELSPKQEACKDKPIGAACSFKYQGRTYYGTCQSYIYQPKHCSDLK